MTKVKGKNLSMQCAWACSPYTWQKILYVTKKILHIVFRWASKTRGWIFFMLPLSRISFYSQQRWCYLDKAIVGHSLSFAFRPLPSSNPAAISPNKKCIRTEQWDGPWQSLLPNSSLFLKLCFHPFTLNNIFKASWIMFICTSKNIL